MREVAAHAGVGLATIYRHFADKDALVLAVVEDRFRQIAGQARDAMDTLEAWPAFVRMMRRMAEMMTEDRALAGAISAARRSRPADGASEGGGDPTGEARAEMDAALSELAERAKAAGELREDVGPLELGLVVGGVAMSLDMAREVRDPPPWERFLEVALDGLREASRGAAGR